MNPVWWCDGELDGKHKPDNDEANNHDDENRWPVTRIKKIEVEATRLARRLDAQQTGK